MEHSHDTGIDRYLLSALLASSSDGIVFFSPDWLIIRANEAFSNQIKMSLQSILGHAVEEILPAWSEQIRHLSSEVCRTGRQSRVEGFSAVFGSDPDGITYWDLTIAPVNRDGKLLGFMLISREASSEARLQAQHDQVLAEGGSLLDQARQLAEERASDWETLFNAIPDVVFVVEHPGKIVLRNHAARTLWATVLPEDASNELDMSQLRAASGLRSPDGRPIPPEEAPTSRALNGEAIAGYLYQTYDQQGGRAYRLSTAVALKTAPGQPKRALCITRDVTDLHRLQEAEKEARLIAERRAAEYRLLERQLKDALTQAESQSIQFGVLFDGISDAILVMDENGGIVFANRAYLWHIGVKDPEQVESMLARNPDCVTLTTSEGTPVPVDEYPSRRLFRGESFVNLPFRMVNVDGREVEFLCSGGTVGLPGGARLLYTISREITEIRRLERAKDEFILMVSHEIRNPLAVIQGTVQLLHMKIPSDSRNLVGKHMSTLTKQVSLLTGMVEDILTAYRIGSGKLSVQLSDARLDTLVTEAVTPFAMSPKHKVTLQPTKMPAILTRLDAQRVMQILQNLLSNAVKYTPEGKRIWVKIETEAQWVLVKVEDEGIGIPAQHLERIFEGFHRPHEFTEWKSGGVGLGLYISRQLARKHGGDLWAENRAGCGTAMVLRLPLYS